jgi:xanthine/uracil permease
VEPAPQSSRLKKFLGDGFQKLLSGIAAAVAAATIVSSVGILSRIKEVKVGDLELKYPDTRQMTK